MPDQRDNDLWSTGARRLAVIGGGISGLAAAYKLHCETADSSRPTQIRLFEGSPRLGGSISTYNLDDMVLELGPDSFITEKPAGLELCRKLGLEDRLIQTDKNHRRTFVAFQNKLHPLPEGFVMMAPTRLAPLLSSDLFSWSAKIRMMKELMIPPAPAGSDESLTQFVERRLGREVLDRVVQPLVGSIYTGDPDKLSVKAALPRITQMEQKYGSLIRGLAAGQKSREASGARYGLFVSFDEGISLLVNTLVAKLPANTCLTHSIVSKLRRQGEKWELEFFDGKKTSVDGVIIATSAFHAADVLEDLNQELSANLAKIDYASSAVLNLIYRRSDIPHALDGFGFVVPRTEKRNILACSFSSVKWPGRAPADKVLLRVFVGGALQPDIYDLADEQIECLMWEDLHTYLGIEALPLLSVISRFPRGMPQYNIGHVDLIESIEAKVAEYPGLALAGNAYHGVGLPDCIASGELAAERILSRFSANEDNSQVIQPDTQRI